MSRIRYLVSYDISNPKRLRKVARSLEGFGVRLQYSVFECPLDDMRLAKLKAELQGLVNHELLVAARVARNKKCAFACPGCPGCPGPVLGCPGRCPWCPGTCPDCPGSNHYSDARALTPVKALRILIES